MKRSKGKAALGAPLPGASVLEHRATLMILFTLALGLAAWHMTRFTVVLDDSFIAFRVAANWARSGVPEYNVGSREWVPTSFLWVALLATGAKLLPAIAFRTTAQFLGGLAGIASILVLAFGFPRSRVAGIAAALLCASSAIWAAWPLSGMDAALFTASVVAGAAVLLQLIDAPTRNRAIATGVVFGLTTVIRPDGFVFAGVAALAVLVWVRDVRMLGWLALGSAIAIAPTVAYMFAALGTVVPVSYYAKVHGLSNVDKGLEYLLDGIRNHRLAYAVPFVAVAFADARSRRTAIVLLAMIAAWVAWVILDGGDFLPYRRFLSPVWPLVTLLCGIGLVATAARLERWRPKLAIPVQVACASLLLFTAAAWTQGSLRGAERARYDADRVDEEMREAIGRYFADKLAPSDWIAVKPAGIIPYYSGAHAIDFFCLADMKAARQGSWVPGAWVGHQRMNAARIHEVAPKIVILDAHLYRLDSMPPPWRTDPNHGAGWLSDPGASRYAPVKAEIVPGYWLGFFVRR